MKTLKFAKITKTQAFVGQASLNSYVTDLVELGGDITG